MFHVAHLKPIHVVTAEYYPNIGKIKNYDFDLGNSFYDQLPINELYRQLKEELDHIKVA